MTRVAITGHTKRIGKAIHDAFPNSIGFSKSQGEDITTIEGRAKILGGAMNCKVFINNAHEGFSQVEMLNMMFTSWRYSAGKHIINIGVDTVPYNNWQVVHNQYPVEKVALHSQAELLQNLERKCKITTLGLGYVDTEFNKDYDGAKLSYDNIIDTIKWIIEQPYEIKQMMVSAK
tara:strand:+ start:229 stop:753 length:525 start_codon:yes stop_codon:yes gene_type:complete